MGLKLNFKLDPRTKIIILVLISFMVFNEVPLYISGILVLIPFICLFFSNRIGIALSYILMYIVAKYIQIYLLPKTKPNNEVIPNLSTLVKNSIYGIPAINATMTGNAIISIGIYPSIPKIKIETVSITAKIPTVIKSFTFNILLINITSYFILY